MKQLPCIKANKVSGDPIDPIFAADSNSFLDIRVQK